MSTLVYMVRHGETEWNRQGLIQGQQDPPLNDLGRNQAKAAGEYLAELRFDYDRIYCSDLQRARQTAEIIAERWQTQVDFREDLREQSFGLMEGFSFEEISLKYPAELSAFRQDPVLNAFPGGESWSDVGQRAQAFLDHLNQEHQGQSVLIVTHGGVIKTLISLILGLPLQYRNRIETTNAGVSVARLDQTQPKVLALNVTHHLAKVF